MALDPTIPNHQQCLQRIAALEDALLKKDPMMPMHLKEIHKQLIQEEELVHLLSDEDIGKIMAAQQQHTNTVLVTEGVKKTSKAAVTKAGAKLTINDL